MNDFKGIFRLWTIFTAVFVVLATAIVAVSMYYRTAEFEKTTKEAYQKLLESHLSKDYGSIADEIYLGLDSFSVREAQLQKLLNKSADIKLIFVKSKSVRPKSVSFRPESEMHWSAPLHDETLLAMPVYFGDIYLGDANVAVHWKGDWTREGRRSLALSVALTILLLLTGWTILIPVLRNYVFIPLLDKILKLQRTAAVSEEARRWSHDFQSTWELLDALLPPIKNLPDDHKQAIDSALLQMKETTDRLKAVAANIEFDSDSVVEKYCLVSNVVESTVSSKKILYKSKGVGIRTEIDGTVATEKINMDRTELSMILSNLIDNAADAMAIDRRPEIILRLKKSETERRMTLAVVDNGKGIPQNILPLLGQEKATFGKMKGSGLGLFNARTSIEKIGGKLSIRSREGFETTVTIEMPLAAAEINQSVQEPNKLTVPDLALIDDQHAVRLSWQVGARMQGKTIRLFEDEQDFLNARLPKQVPVYVDYYLGDVAGLEVLERLHALGYNNLNLTTALKDVVKPLYVREVVSKSYPTVCNDDSGRYLKIKGDNVERASK